MDGNEEKNRRTVKGPMLVNLASLLIHWSVQLLLC